MDNRRCPKEWSEWCDWLAAGLHGRCRWRLAVVLGGMLFAGGRRTVASWLRAAAVGLGFSSYYYFIADVGRNSTTLAERLVVLLLRHLPTGDWVLAALDDTPTKRYGPKVQGAGIHHNPNPGPADAQYLYGHIWLTLAWIVRHPRWGTLGLPLRAMLYIRRKHVSQLPPQLDWTFQTKLQQAVELIAWFSGLLQAAGKRLRVVSDGFYAKRPVLKAARSRDVVIVGRLRKDARLWTLPPEPQPGQRGRPRKYGTGRISLAKRAGQKKGWSTIECFQYSEWVEKTYKTFLATYRPAYGLIRVVIVQEVAGPQFFFSTDPNMSVRDILECFADRAAIEQVFHDLKEVWGAAQQQVRYLWANIGVWHLNLWMHTLVELWAWKLPKAKLCDRRDSPWDDPDRRPSHADRRKALRRMVLTQHFSAIQQTWALPRKIRQFAKQLIRLAV